MRLLDGGRAQDAARAAAELDIEVDGKRCPAAEVVVLGCRIGFREMHVAFAGGKVHAGERRVTQARGRANELGPPRTARRVTNSERRKCRS